LEIGRSGQGSVLVSHISERLIIYKISLSYIISNVIAYAHFLIVAAGGTWIYSPRMYTPQSKIDSKPINKLSSVALYQYVLEHGTQVVESVASRGACE
jgi:hypothetical protein